MEPPPFDRRWDHGPFDVVGDVHGCLEELRRLLHELGWRLGGGPPTHPAGRRAVFVGDLVDRGPEIPGVLRLAMEMVAEGTALCVLGNHDRKLARALEGRGVRVAHGLEHSLAQLAADPGLRSATAAFLRSLPHHLLLAGGELVVAHAGLREDLFGADTPGARDFALYGDTTGERDEYGLPVRLDWARHYRGRALVVYGHTPVVEPRWLNGTVNLDTGCVFGGRLTALRWPERETVSVPAARVYYRPAKPFPGARAG
jgi:diadenosine tetraphosphatase ApaH/serine/threonine PP2A family protein phosphatase